MIITDTCNVDGTNIKFDAKSLGASLDVCTAKSDYTIRNTSECTTAANETYFKVVCEDKISAEYDTTKTKYYKGDDFDITASVLGYVECTGTFEYSKWIKAYKNGDESVKSRLVNILNNFVGFEMGTYKLSNLSGTITYETQDSKKSGSQSFSSFVQTQTSSSTKNVIYGETINNVRVPKSFTYQTNMVKAVASLAKTIEVDGDTTATPYTVILKNAGYSQNSTLYFNCEIEKINTIYRPIDPSNPFISVNRITGENWLNEKYDFRKIISDKVWSDSYEAEYEFYITKSDLANINKDTESLGNKAYTGYDCTKKDSDGYLTCDMLRDTSLFSGIKIRGRTYK